MSRFTSTMHTLSIIHIDIVYIYTILSDHILSPSDFEPQNSCFSENAVLQVCYWSIIIVKQ